MDTTVVAPAILKFSAKFLQEMDQTKSVVASPLSAEITLALAALGATGATHTELLEGLEFLDDNTVRTSFEFLTSSLKSLKALNVANKIYLQEGRELLPTMKKDAELFDTEFGEVDFEDSERTASEINNWVEKKTNGKIKDIYSSDGSEEDIGLVLLNAIYFKGSWLHSFDLKSTRNEPFRVDSTKVIAVPMMFKCESFNFGCSKALNALVAIFSYKESNSKMAIILPRELDGLEEVLKKLAEGHDILSDIKNLKERKIYVALPKFKIETTVDLKDVLKKLGITAMFEGGFTKIICDSKPLKVSEAVQKAFIEVNEEGTEAAVVTTMRVPEYLCMPPRFHAVYPFAYIVFGPGDIPIFVGAYRGDETAPLSTIEEFKKKWRR